MICGNCGVGNPDGSNFCGGCGQRLPVTKEREPLTGRTNPDGSPGKLREAPVEEDTSLTKEKGLLTGVDLGVHAGRPGRPS